MVESKGVKMSKIIHQTIEFNAPPEIIFELLMDEKKHAAFTGAPAEIGHKAGDSFSVWDGYAVGKNLEIIPNKKIVQTWRASDWPEGVESKVTFELNAKGDGCELKFTQTSVPDEFTKDIEQGWIDNYWDLMKVYLNK